MHYIIHALDKVDAPGIRQSFYENHKSFLGDADRFNVRVLVSGPLLHDDHNRPIGSFFLLEALDRASVDAFHEADPFKTAGVWDRVVITPFLKRQDVR